MEEIITHLNSGDLWEIELYMVSNDNISMKPDDHTISMFSETYSLSVHSITLKEIIPYITDFPKDLSAKFITNSTSVMTYEINELSSSKSYLIKLSLAELIRITCSDKDIRVNTTSDHTNLRSKTLDTSLLFDNVRGYLGETTFNKNIVKTIKEDPNKFFMYNNGLTVTAKNIKAGPINGNKRFQCEINGFQIVNGGQTLRSIYKFCNEHFDEEKLVSAEILVRLFQTEADETLTNNIAEYTNSQNAISLMDLKSVNNFQIQIEAFLKSNDIHYVRKNGDMGDKDTDYEKRISMKRVSQIIYSSLGFPDRSINQTKALFGKYYDEIFSEDILSFNDLLTLINMHFEVIERYKESTYIGFEGKFLYVIYIKKLAPQKSLIECIELLEEFIVDYKKEDSISVARKLIQKGFKDYVEDKVNTEIQ
ncbi:AIPR family protein [Exiguobacterium sp. S17]|nr:AIPR family protein [Exiguobacterium sp. S17]